MEHNKQLHDLLTHRMAVEEADMEAPDLLRHTAARQAVMARKKPVAREEKNLLQRMLLFFNPDFKFYHLGVSVLMIVFGMVYITEAHYSNGAVSGFSSHSYNDLSIKNSTISVNSSTMLTSIPTLRN